MLLPVVWAGRATKPSRCSPATSEHHRAGIDSTGRPSRRAEAWEVLRTYPVMTLDSPARDERDRGRQIGDPDNSPHGNGKCPPPFGRSDGSGSFPVLLDTVTVPQNLQNRSTSRNVSCLWTHGGGTFPPPCDLGFCTHGLPGTVPQRWPYRRLICAVHGGADSAPPSPARGDVAPRTSRYRRIHI